MNRTIPIAINNIVQVTKTIASKQIPAVTAVVSTATSSLINLKVDGHSVKVSEGSTILDAINNSGSHVPTLCYHPEFEPKAVCKLYDIVLLTLQRSSFSRICSHHMFNSCISYIGRMCLVDVKGEKKPLPACRTKVSEGQEIQTNTENLKAFRRR